MTLFRILCILWLPTLGAMCSSASIAEQKTNSTFDSSYLPLKVGNVWNLRITDGLSYFDTDLRFYRVLDSLTIGTEHYVRCHNLWYSAPTAIDTMRTDTVGDAWRLHCGVEEQIFKLTASPGETWSFTYADSQQMQMKYLGVLDSFQLPEGPLHNHVFRQVKAFYGEVPGVTDSWINIAIAPGVGVIYRSWSQMYQVLYGAAIGGALVGDTLTTGLNFRQTERATSLQLYQNYPNPFNPSTIIRYALPVRSEVALMIFNTLGQEVARPLSAEQEAGIHEMRIDGADLPSGVYFYKLQVGNYVRTQKMILLR